MILMQSFLESLRTKWKQAAAHDHIIATATFIYLIAVSIFLIWHGVFFSPDIFFVLAFLAMLIIGKAWTFFWDWLPALLLIFGYEYLRGLVPQLTNRVHAHLMIYFDTTLFGKLPTTALQAMWFNPNHIHWYDFYFAIIYFLHFVTPMLAALLFWFVDRQFFKRYMAGMIILSYITFLTYYLFPAMPPWMAGQIGYIPQVYKILNVAVGHLGHSLSLPTIYQTFGANLVAAVPSLHAAYPLLTGLFLFKRFKKKALPFFIYVASVWLAVVYLGEHYVFDVLLGITYALTSFAIINRDWRPVWQKIRKFFKPSVLKPPQI